MLIHSLGSRDRAKLNEYMTVGEAAELLGVSKDKRPLPRPSALVHLDSGGTGQNVGSDCSVCWASGQADHAAVHSLHAEGQAGDGEFDSVRVLSSDR